MVMHVLKSDLVLQELEHVQVDGPGTAYLFYDKQGHWGLGQDAVDAVPIHVEEAFSEWISCSAHFNISLLPLMEVWWWSIAASDCQRLRSWVENSAHNTSAGAAWESDSSSQLVGNAPLGWERGLRQGSPPVPGQHDRMKGHQSPSALQSVEGVQPLLPQTGEHQTLMDTPLQVRPRDASIGAEATEGVGRGNGWCPRDWIYQSLSRLIWGRR